MKPETPEDYENTFYIELFKIPDIRIALLFLEIREIGFTITNIIDKLVELKLPDQEIELRNTLTDKLVEILEKCKLSVIYYRFYLFTHVLDNFRQEVYRIERDFNK